MKKITNKSFAMIAAIVMLLSLFAFPFFLAFGNQAAVQGGANQVTLPTQLVLTERMSPAQFNFAVQRGLTVATYTYDPTCTECQEEIQILEQIVFSQEFQSQIILEEIEGTGPSELEVNSFVGTTTVEEITQEEAAKVFCQMVASPPLECVGVQ